MATPGTKAGGDRCTARPGSGHREIVELLLANGANVNVPTLSGKTALDYASRAGHNKTADLLRHHGGKTRAELKTE